MILEGIVTTLGPDGVNVAPMGPDVPPEYPGPDFASFTLLPFRSSRTYANLALHPEGVLHVSDDVLLLARAAVGDVEPAPTLLPAVTVQGWILADACRAYEFRVLDPGDDGPRPRCRAQVVGTHRLRDFFGYNRAQFAVIEAAILATRLDLLPREEVEVDYRRLARLVEKTGGPREREAFALLQRHLIRTSP